MRIYLGTFIYLILQIASVVLPRFILNPSEGFVVASDAIIFFLSIQLVAGILSVGQFFYTYRTRHKLTRPQVITGMLPLAISILGVVIFLAIFRYG